MPFAKANYVEDKKAKILHQYYFLKDAFSIDYYELNAYETFQEEVHADYDCLSLTTMIQGLVIFKNKDNQPIRKLKINHHHLVFTKVGAYATEFTKGMNRFMIINFDRNWLKNILKDQETIAPMLNAFIEGDDPNPAMRSILIVDMDLFLGKFQFKRKLSFGETIGLLTTNISTILKNYNNEVCKLLNKESNPEIEKYLRKNLHDSEITASTILTHFYYVSNLEHNFKVEYGCYPMQFLGEIRIEKAKKLLLEKPLKTILEISGLIGYTAVRSFNKQFKEKTGLTPTQYRKNNLK